MVTDSTCISSTRRWLQLIAPLLAAIRLPSVSDIRCRLLLQILHLIHDYVTLKEIYGPTFSRFKAERGMEILAHLVAIDDGPILGRHIYIRQLPSLITLVCFAQLIVL